MSRALLEYEPMLGHFADYPTWNRNLLRNVTCIVVSIILFNVLVDPYEIFGIVSYRGGFAPNERFNKVDYLLAHPKKYDSFILGSSVMGQFNPRLLDLKRPGQRAYNLSYLRGTPAEALATLRTLQANGVRIKEIVMGIDVFPFIESSEYVEPFRRPHPSVSGESAASFYLSYVFTSGLVQGINRLSHAFEPQPKITFDLRGTGEYRLLSYDREILKDQSAFIKRQMAPIADAKKAKFVWVQKRFNELQALKDWLAAGSIRAEFFIHPLHHSTLDLIEQASLTEFRSKVLSILGPVPDYSRTDRITQDDRNYYDRKHYRAFVAEEILMQIL